MKHVYKIVFIFCTFLLLLGINIQGAKASCECILKENAIYSVKTIENADAAKIENETTISRNINENIQNSARIKTTSAANGFPHSEIAQNKLFEIISYVYSKSYLDNVKNKNLFLITSSIKPNAP